MEVNRSQSAWRAVAPNVWMHTYAFDAHGTANSMAFRLDSGGVAVVSPPCKPAELVFDEVAALGSVEVLVAPNAMHHLGQTAWRARFPRARCFAPAGAHARINKQNATVGPLEDLDALRVVVGTAAHVGEAPGTRHGECWIAVSSGSGFVWYVGDVLVNMPSLPAPLLPRWLFWLSGSAPGFRVFHLALLASAHNKAALLSALGEDLERFPPAVLVPGHGEPVEHDVVGRVRALLRPSSGTRS